MPVWDDLPDLVDGVSPEIAASSSTTIDRFFGGGGGGTGLRMDIPKYALRDSASIRLFREYGSIRQMVRRRIFIV